MIMPGRENRNFLINDQKPTRKVIAQNLHRLKQTSKSGGAFINLCSCLFTQRPPPKNLDQHYFQTSLVPILWGVPAVILLRNT